ncbi:MAG: glycoside hydrolase family 25 protein [Solobacterium sp.]|nr:glycoside hydrolase family 25 protein [Solobacterium sp.]
MTKKRRTYRRRKQSHILINIICICILVFAVTVLILRTRQGKLRHVPEDKYVSLPFETNDYDFDRLNWDGQKAVYEDDKYTSRWGIDVSSHNGDIDWKQVKEAGVEFAFIRAGYRGNSQGKLHKDSRFEANYKGAHENGIPVGIYFFSQAATEDEAWEEVELVESYLQGKQIDLPVVFDMEESGEGDKGRVKPLNRDQKTRIAVTWLEGISQKGYKPMIYNSKSLLNHLFSIGYLQNYDFWVAQYNNKPTYDYRFSVWQYSNTGEIPGIPKAVDLDLMLVEKTGG